MKYEQHDFISNVAQYNKTGQDEKVRSLLMSELSQLIIYHRGSVLMALNDSGIKTDKTATEDELVEKLSKNLATNEKLKRTVSALLVDLNMHPKSKMYMNAAGETLSQRQLDEIALQYGYRKKYYGSGGGMSGGAGALGAGTDTSGTQGSTGSSNGSQTSNSGYSGGAQNMGSGSGSQGGAGASQRSGGDPVSAIAGAIGNIFGFAKSKTDAKTQADNNRMQLAQQLLANKQAVSPSKTGTYVAITLVALTIIGIATYFVMKKPMHPPSGGSSAGTPAAGGAGSPAPSPIGAPLPA